MGREDPTKWNQPYSCIPRLVLSTGKGTAGKETPATGAALGLLLRLQCPSSAPWVNCSQQAHSRFPCLWLLTTKCTCRYRLNMEAFGGGHCSEMGSEVLGQKSLSPSYSWRCDKWPASTSALGIPWKGRGQRRRGGELIESRDCV